MVLQIKVTKKNVFPKGMQYSSDKFRAQLPDSSDSPTTPLLEWWGIRVLSLPEQPPPPPQLRRATGRLVGLSLENELGSLKPWSVGLGVEHWELPCSEGGEGEAEGAPPPMW